RVGVYIAELRPGRECLRRLRRRGVPREAARLLGEAAERITEVAREVRDGAHEVGRAPEPALRAPERYAPGVPGGQRADGAVTDHELRGALQQGRAARQRVPRELRAQRVAERRRR